MYHKLFFINLIIFHLYYSEIDVICTDNNNVNVEYLQSPAVHVNIIDGFYFLYSPF